jgi:fatty-acid peroxygenase
VLLERAVFLSGREASAFFYDRSQFRRAGAMPGFLEATLFGAGGVQGLDGAAHRHRKALSLGLAGPERTGRPVALGLEDVERALHAPPAATLQEAFEIALTRAAFRWTALPVPEEELPARTRDIASRFKHAGSVNLHHLQARRARHTTERWARRAVEDTRSGRIAPPEGSPLATVSAWRDPAGELLPADVASVELLNLIRPYVAISAYLTFAAHRLAVSPEWRDRLRAAPELVPAFVTELRRTAPFFPMLTARAAVDTCWRGHSIPEDRLVLLDLYGTNRDPSAWSDPEAFRPERFDGHARDPFALIPQGGNGHEEGHRCSGEWITEELIAGALPLLIEGIDWQALPPQDLDLDMRRLPALPADGLRLP